MILELHFVTYIRNFFGHYLVTFPYKEILSFFGHFHVTFPYMEGLSVFGGFKQNVIVSCSSESFVQKTTHQSGGSSNVTSDFQLLYKLIKEQPVFLVQTHMKKIM